MSPVVWSRGFRQHQLADARLGNLLADQQAPVVSFSVPDSRRVIPLFKEVCLLAGLQLCN